MYIRRTVKHPLQIRFVKQEDAPEPSDPDTTGKEFGDFKFRPGDLVTMLPVDELFSNDKLVPLQHSMVRPALTLKVLLEIRSPDMLKAFQAVEVLSHPDLKQYHILN
ncbi:hypothetical protein U1Q18_017340 [Sarracenia purpurea var. burkii]